jgi:hypothetical protein
MKNYLLPVLAVVSEPLGAVIAPARFPPSTKSD